MSGVTYNSFARSNNDLVGSQEWLSTPLFRNHRRVHAFAKGWAGRTRQDAFTELPREFPDCETGAMPPFGNLYDMAVFADESLAHDQVIAFNAGSHRELIRLAWEDFERLVKPTVVRLAAGRKADTAA